MVDKKTVKTDNTENTEIQESWINNHNLDELIITTNLNILPKFELIQEKDLITSRKVVIETLPVKTFIKKLNQHLDYMVISDNKVKYSLPANSISLQRSLISLAIKESKAKEVKDIDMSKILGKMYILKRNQFTSKSGFTTSPLIFLEMN